MDRDQWSESIRKNGELIAAALDEARNQMPDDADAGNALAFAVAVAIPPDGIEAFVDSLRTFSRARASAGNKLRQKG